MQIVGEQISRVLYALQLDNDILFLDKEDTIGKTSQDLSLKKRESI